jgi:hypothetical protein
MGNTRAESLVRMTPADIANQLSRFRYSFATEDELQRGILQVLPLLRPGLPVQPARRALLR